MNPLAPIFVVTKGRYQTQLTSRALDRMKVPHHLVVEENEVELYAPRKYKTATIVVLDPEYKRRYETCDDLGMSKGVGPGAARNFAWDHAIDMGAEWHWVMDDNIDGFYRLNYNLKTPVADGTVLRVMEVWCQRYDNVLMAGPQYFMFAPTATVKTPVILNTRIYSCNLIRNDAPYRWRGRYNEDTDLSLRMLKDGWVTAQFYVFLQNKMRTQNMGGGNTAEFYKEEGTLPKSQMLVDLHPDVARLTWKFQRDHHEVDYSGFANNKPHLREGVEIPSGVDNFGMKLQRRINGRWYDVRRPFDEPEVDRSSPSRLVQPSETAVSNGASLFGDIPQAEAEAIEQTVKMRGAH